MGIISSAAGTFYTYRFLRILTQDWKDMPAYEDGIIDANGNVLRKANSLSFKEKDNYTTFHRLVFNIKRLLEKLPINSKLSTYAAALFLLREEYDIDEELILEELDHQNELTEEAWFVQKDCSLSPGQYAIKERLYCPINELFYNKGSAVTVTEDSYLGHFGGCNIYKVTHSLSGIPVHVTTANLEKGKL